MFVSILTVLCSMCTASKTHVDPAFQVSPAMKVTCRSGWGDRHMVFSNHVCYKTQAMP